MRTTASVQYTRPLDSGNAWSTSLIWGRNHDTFTQHNLNSYLAETVYPIGKRNFLSGRFELVDKDELFSDTPDLEAQLDRTTGSMFRIGGYTAGYTRDIPLFKGVETGIGGGTWQPWYGVGENPPLTKSACQFGESEKRAGVRRRFAASGDSSSLQREGTSV